MPTTAPDIVLTPVDTAVVIAPLANDSGDGLALDGFTQPAHGIVVANPDDTLTYTPAPGFSGVDSFSYTVRDAAGATATGSVTISVLAPNTPPAANDDEATVTDGATVEIPVLANDDDPDGDPLRLVAIGTPAHGTASFVAPDRIRYRPQPGFSGIDRFTYTVDDGNGGTATGSVTVRVAGANRAPLAADFEVETIEGAPLVLDLLARASDPDGDPLRLEALGVPRHGRIAVNPDHTVTYTPQPGYEGEDSFAWTVGDGRGGTATGTVRVRVVRPNQPPAANDDTLTTPQDTPLAFDPLAGDTDPDGDPLRLSGFALPRRGRLGLDGNGRLVYTPDAGFTGEDSFTYTIDDGRGGTATGTIRITVTPAQPPAATFANGWPRRRRILLPARSDSSEIVDGFVLLVREQGDWLRSLANGGEVASEEGFDLRFELEDGTKLAHEIEHYDPVAGTLVAWVRIPDWDIAARKVLFLYHGRSDLAASEADPAATWQDHLAVWDTRTGRDRSGNGRDLTPTAILDDELVGPAGRFDGTGDLRLADASFLGGLAALCVTAVVRADAAIVGDPRAARILQQGDPTASAGAAGLALFHNSPGYFGGAADTIKFALRTTAGSVQLEGPPDLQRAAPMVLAATWSSGELPRLFVDGGATAPSWVGLASGNAGQPDVVAQGTTDMVAGQPFSLGLGGLDPARSWFGTIDEVRVRASVPPAAQLALEADNILAPWRVYALGGGETPETTDFPPIVPDIEVATRAGRHVDIDALAAAYDPEGGPLAIAAVEPPLHGTASVIGSLLRYTPLAGFTGEDSFGFAVRDAAANDASGLVRVQVSELSSTSGELPPPRRTVRVGNSSELAAALADARPGDHIVLASGDYAATTIDVNGTAGDPIVVRAATKHGARFTGRVTLEGSHTWLYQLHFDSTDWYSLDINEADDCIVRRSKFTRDNAIIVHRSRNCEIGYNLFELPAVARSTDTNAILINPRYSQDLAAGRFIENITIRRNLFTTSSVSNVTDNIRCRGIYVSTFWQPDYPLLNSTIEYNLFNGYGRGRQIYSKMRGLTVQYNTIIAPSEWTIASIMALVQRNGGQHTWKGNWIEGEAYADAFDQRSLWIGNKIVGSGAFRVFAGDNKPDTLTQHAPATDQVYAWNSGTIRVGFEYYKGDGPFPPATGTRIEAHTGTVELLPWQTGTTQSPTSGYARVVPIRLTPDQVGPDAP